MIAELDLSEAIKEVFIGSGHWYFSQLLDKSPEELMEIPGLSMKQISEYKNFIIKNNLQEIQKDF